MDGKREGFNTIPPSDSGFFELMNEMVRDVPAGSTNAELMGHPAAIGIGLDPERNPRRAGRGRTDRRHGTSRARDGQDR